MTTLATMPMIRTQPRIAAKRSRSLRLNSMAAI
jgi:hypothetical protein